MFTNLKGGQAHQRFFARQKRQLTSKVQNQKNKSNVSYFTLALFGVFGGSFLCRQRLAQATTTFMHVG
jgi:hypothetical protein